MKDEQEDHWRNLLKIHWDGDLNGKEMQRKEQLDKIKQTVKTKFKNFSSDLDRIEIEKSEVNTVLQEFHDAPLGGHVGVRRMKKRIKALFFWRGMDSDIEGYVRCCKSCQFNKIGKFNKIPMQITTTSKYAFEKLYMDIVVLPESEGGKQVWACHSR